MAHLASLRFDVPVFVARTGDGRGASGDRVQLEERNAGDAGFVVAPTGGLAMAQEDDCVRQDLLLLLLTTPGERVMWPEFGCHLRRLLFQPNDATLAGLAIHYVRQAVERFEPRVEIVALDAGPEESDPEGATLEITLRYRVRRNRREERLQLRIDLDGLGRMRGEAGKCP